jgi:predicted ArsR family transcriptional regulator
MARVDCSMALKLPRGSELYQVWAEIRHDAQMSYNPLTESILKILLILEKDGPRYGSAIARAINLNQGNVTARYLPTMDRLHLVTWNQVKREYRGGRPALEWRIIEKGRRVLTVASCHENGAQLSRIASELGYPTRTTQSGVRIP